MALIKCPECGKEISDKAPACIHCGFPLSLVEKQNEPNITTLKNDDIKESTVNDSPSTSPNGYSLELLDYGNKKTQVALALKNTLKMKDAEALELVASAPCYLFRDKQEREIMPMIHKLDTLPVEYNLYMEGKLKRHKTKVEINKPLIQASTSYSSVPIRTTSYTKKIMCPNCSSLIEETSRVCPICGFDGIGSYLLKLEREKQEKIRDYTHDYEPITPRESVKNVPKCPTCQSTNIKKVSTASKAGSVFMWGLLSQKVKKQWHCNNCGYEW